LLRKTLAGQPDKSVVMIQVGFSTNLARLLDSKGDSSSPLSGKELVHRKVRLLSLMAGKYDDTDFDGSRVPKTTPEFNIVFDIPSAQHLFEDWPTPIVASGLEIGASMLFQGSVIDHDFLDPRTNPVVAVYKYTDPIYQTKAAESGRLHDHPTYDLTAVLYAIRVDEGYFSLSPPGRISVQPDGSARFAASPTGSHRYLMMNDDQRTRALAAMTLLVTQPPLENSTQSMNHLKACARAAEDDRYLGRECRANAVSSKHCDRMSS
jgi:inosine-uridine nucleoside N-ribohydrolase